MRPEERLMILGEDDWQLSKKGNEYIRIPGYTITLLEDDFDNFYACIYVDEEKKTSYTRKFKTVDQLKQGIVSWIENAGGDE